MDRSGLLLISDNHEAFAVRALMAREAKVSLDLIYYLWRADRTGSLLTEEVVKAADRGVRVRVLLDDINPYNSDVAQKALERHANIELKLFNPSRARHGSFWRAIEIASHLFALSRRMHNKAWIADGEMAVIGGRNIADEYFDAAETNFRDLDVLLRGPAVAQTQTIFEAFWTCPGAKSIAAVDPLPARKQKRWQKSAPKQADRELVAALNKRIEAIGALSKIADDDERLHWVAGARVVSDPPEKARGRKRENWLMRELLPAIQSAKQRLELTSPYFIPGERGLALLTGLVRSGVETTVLTNSLAATDVAAVHGAYANYRVDLLKGGIHLHELQPFNTGSKISVFGSKGASLHTKSFTVDESTGFVGSFNFDPRSVSLNTEMGVLFEDAGLVAELRELFRQETAPDTSFHLELRDGRLRWFGEEDNVVREFSREPEASIFRRLIAGLVRYLPIESQL